MRPPKNPIHPGEILLEEFLKPAGETQAAFAARIGWTRARLNELISGKRGITADAALDLADALGTSGKVWMNLQSTWDLAQATKRGARRAHRWGARSRQSEYAAQPQAHVVLSLDSAGAVRKLLPSQGGTMRSLPLAFVFVVAVGVALAQAPRSYSIDAAPAEYKQAIDRAKRAFDSLQSTLSARLLSETKAGGPAHAVGVCRDEAPALTRPPASAPRRSRTEAGEASPVQRALTSDHLSRLR